MIVPLARNLDVEARTGFYRRTGAAFLMLVHAGGARAGELFRHVSLNIEDEPLPEGHIVAFCDGEDGEIVRRLVESGALNDTGTRFDVGPRSVGLFALGETLRPALGPPVAA